ncbi:hypothetical protein RFI_31839, partial [Reticulomyxa filosa]
NSQRKKPTNSNMVTEKMKSADVKADSKETTEATAAATAAAKTEGNKAYMIQRLCDSQRENARLRAELKRIQKERESVKKELQCKLQTLKDTLLLQSVDCSKKPEQYETQVKDSKDTIQELRNQLQQMNQEKILQSKRVEGLQKLANYHNERTIYYKSAYDEIKVKLETLKQSLYSSLPPSSSSGVNTNANATLTSAVGVNSNNDSNGNNGNTRKRKADILEPLHDHDRVVKAELRDDIAAIQIINGQVVCVYILENLSDPALDLETLMQTLAIYTKTQDNASSNLSVRQLAKCQSVQKNIHSINFHKFSTILNDVMLKIYQNIANGKMEAYVLKKSLDLLQMDTLSLTTRYSLLRNRHLALEKYCFVRHGKGQAKTKKLDSHTSYCCHYCSSQSDKHNISEQLRQSKTSINTRLDAYTNTNNISIFNADSKNCKSNNPSATINKKPVQLLEQLLNITVLQNSHYLPNIATKMALTAIPSIIIHPLRLNVYYNNHCHRTYQCSCNGLFTYQLKCQHSHQLP